MTYPDKEYQGKQLKVLLTDGEFQLVDTNFVDSYQSYQNAWIWHMCDKYKQDMVVAGATPVGLLSNKEIAEQRCSYCLAKIPDGMIGQFKMINWEYIDVIVANEVECGNG